MLHVIRNRDEHEAGPSNVTGPSSKKTKRIQERYTWEIKKKGSVIKKSGDTFLTMKKCILDAKKIKLAANETIDYRAEDWEHDGKGDIIDHVFKYLLQHDYKIICFFKCHGCLVNDECPDNHEIFCIKSSVFIPSMNIACEAHKKIHVWRLQEAVYKVAPDFSIEAPGSEDINQYLIGVSDELYRMGNQPFEAELCVLDDINISDD